MAVPDGKLALQSTAHEIPAGLLVTDPPPASLSVSRNVSAVVTEALELTVCAPLPDVAASVGVLFPRHPVRVKEPTVASTITARVPVEIILMESMASPRTPITLKSLPADGSPGVLQFSSGRV
jgi:hypothetical protein